MPQLISTLLTYRDPEQLADAIRQACSDGGLVGVEGFMNSGKTRLAFELADILGGIRVGLDSYFDPGKVAADYIGRLRLDYLAKDLVKLRAVFSFVIVEGICLTSAINSRQNPIARTVYVKRISPAGIWHDQIRLENYKTAEVVQPTCLKDYELSYNSNERPHERADYFYERIEI